MKIAYILDEYPSRTETFIAREIEALRRHGLEIDVWALRPGKDARPIATSTLGRGLAKLKGATDEHWRETGRRWARQEAENLKNVTHIHAGWASFPAEIARGASEVLNVPWSFSGHARDIWVEGGDLVGKLASARFASVCTRSGVGHLQQTAPAIAAKVLYVPHGIEVLQYEYFATRTLHAPIQLLAVGRLIPKKGFSLLIEAVARLQERGHAVHATIIGEGPQRKELEKIKNSHIVLAGAKTHEQVKQAMRDADLLVMPTRIAPDGDRDGLPNVLLEAAAIGLPIVSTHAGSVEDFLDEACSRLCPPDHPGEFAAAIESAFKNYDESLHRAQQARARVARRYDADTNIQTLLEAFTSASAS